MVRMSGRNKAKMKKKSTTEWIKNHCSNIIPEKKEYENDEINVWRKI